MNMKNFFSTALMSILFSAPAAAYDRQIQLEDLGGSGVKIFDGRNERAWIQKSCKIVIMGTEKHPVAYLSVLDSQNSYTFWTSLNSSFATGSGGSLSRVAVSDVMIFAENGGQFGRRGYSNIAQGKQKNISEVILSTDPLTGALQSVHLRHLDPKEGMVLNEVLCTKLKLRK